MPGANLLCVVGECQVRKRFTQITIDCDGAYLAPYGPIGTFPLHTYECHHVRQVLIRDIVVLYPEATKATVQDDMTAAFVSKLHEMGYEHVTSEKGALSSQLDTTYMVKESKLREWVGTLVSRMFHLLERYMQTREISIQQVHTQTKMACTMICSGFGLSLFVLHLQQSQKSPNFVFLPFVMVVSSV